MTNRLLHLAAGPELAARDGKVGLFPEDFAWIHGYDALRSSQAGAAVLATR